MSAGPFSRTFYSDNDDEIHPLRVQPETLLTDFDGTVNAAPAGPVTSEISAKVTGSRRGIGLFARYVTIAFGATAPAGYRPFSNHKIVVPDKTVWDGITKNSTVTYLSTAGTVISKTDEEQR